MAHLPADLPPLPGATADAAIFPAGPGRSAQPCERSILLRYLGQVQQRVGRQFEELRAEVHSELQAELQAEHDAERRALAAQLAARDDQLLALHGQLMVRDTALELLREELAELRRQVPGLAGRQELVRLLDIQAERIVALERERNAALWRAERESLRAREAAAGPRRTEAYRSSPAPIRAPAANREDGPGTAQAFGRPAVAIPPQPGMAPGAYSGERA